MTTEATTTDTTNPELDRLREHNKQLLAELKAERTAHKAAQDALQAAQGAETAWRDRVYQGEVMAPLEADLRGAAAGPWKYLKDLCTEAGLLKMEPGADGFDRPTWYDEKGEPADLAGGLYRFLCEVYRRTDNDLGNCLRASGISGGGATGSVGTFTPAPKPAAPTVPAPQFGLR